MSSIGFTSQDGEHDILLQRMQVHVDVDVCGMNVQLDQHFLNPGNEIRDAGYEFCIANAAIYQFEALIGDKKLIAVVQSKEEAKQTYKNAIKQKSEAILLEQQPESQSSGPGTNFQLLIGIIPPNSTVSITLRYVTRITTSFDSDHLEAVVPLALIWEALNTAKQRQNPYNVQISVQLSLPGIQTLICKSHDISMRPTEYLQLSPNSTLTPSAVDGKGNLLVNLSKLTDLAKDFVLSVVISDEQLQKTPFKAAIEFSPSTHSFATFLSFFPDLDETFGEPDVRSEILLLVDMSSSMSGFPIEQTIKALQQAITKMKQHKYVKFNVIAFGVTSEKLYTEFKKINEESLKDAVTFIESLRSNMGSAVELEAVLNDAYRLKKAQHFTRQILIFTDGNLNCSQKALDIVKKNAHCRLFCIGFCDSSVTARKLSDAGNGRCEFVRNSQELPEKMSAILGNLLAPAVTDVSLEWGTLKKFSVTQAPYHLQPIYHKRTYEVFALIPSFAERICHRVRLHGRMGNRKCEFVFELDLSSAKGGDLIHLLTARSLIEDLVSGNSQLHEQHLSDETEQLRQMVKEQIIVLGSTYNLASPHTSFVAVDESFLNSEFPLPQQDRVERDDYNIDRDSPDHMSQNIFTEKPVENTTMKADATNPFDEQKDDAVPLFMSDDDSKPPLQQDDSQLPHDKARTKQEEEEEAAWKSFPPPDLDPQYQINVQSPLGNSAANDEVSESGSLTDGSNDDALLGDDAYSDELYDDPDESLLVSRSPNMGPEPQEGSIRDSPELYGNDDDMFLDDEPNVDQDDIFLDDEPAWNFSEPKEMEPDSPHAQNSDLRGSGHNTRTRSRTHSRGDGSGVSAGPSGDVLTSEYTKSETPDKQSHQHAQPESDRKVDPSSGLQVADELYDLFGPPSTKAMDIPQSPKDTFSFDHTGTGSRAGGDGHTDSDSVTVSLVGHTIRQTIDEQKVAHPDVDPSHPRPQTHAHRRISSLGLGISALPYSYPTQGIQHHFDPQTGVPLLTSNEEKQPIVNIRDPPDSSVRNRGMSIHQTLERNRNEQQEQIERNAVYQILNAADSQGADVFKSLLCNLIDVKDKAGWTPLHRAADAGQLLVARALVSAGADPSITDKHGWNTLHLAAMRGHIEIAELLAPLPQSDINSTDKFGECCLHFASQNSHLDIVRLLLSSSANASTKNNYNSTPLHKALQSEKVNKDIVCALLEAKADPNIVNNNSVTPLHCAANDGDITTLSSLLDANADISAVSANGNTVLHFAAKSGRSGILKLLMQNLSNEMSDVANEDQETPLHLASRHGHLDSVKMLISLNADIFVRSKIGATALHMASEKGHVEIVQCLVEAQSDINTQSEDESTPVLCAAVEGHTDIVILLVEHDALLTCDSKNSVSVLDAAAVVAQNGRPYLLNIVRKNFAVKQAMFVEMQDILSVKRLGEGAFGLTFRSELRVRKKMHKVVLPNQESVTLYDDVSVSTVCKVPKFGVSQDEWYELSVLQNVPANPNVLGLVGICMAFEFEGRRSVAIILPLKHGGGLNQFLWKNGPQRLSTLIHFGLDMAKGVLHLHNHGYCHNDIAARNFLLRDPPSEAWDTQKIILCDFGLSRPLYSNYAETEQSHAAIKMLPFRWSSPETIQSQGRRINQHSDVWMLGVVFWELLGYKETPASNMVSHKQLKTYYQNEKTHALNFDESYSPCPEFWKNLITKCCQFSPEMRPTAEQVRNILQKAKDSPDNKISEEKELEGDVSVHQELVVESATDFDGYSEYAEEYIELIELGQRDEVYVQSKGMFTGPPRFRRTTSLRLRGGLIATPGLPRSRTTARLHSPFDDSYDDSAVVHDEGTARPDGGTGHARQDSVTSIISAADLPLLESHAFQGYSPAVSEEEALKRRIEELDREKKSILEHLKTVSDNGGQ